MYIFIFVFMQSVYDFSDEHNHGTMKFIQS